MITRYRAQKRETCRICGKKDLIRYLSLGDTVRRHDRTGAV